MNSFVHDTDEEDLLARLENPNLEQAHVTLLLGRLDLPANVWSAVARKGNWRSSKGVRVRLARHPRAPKRIALFRGLFRGREDVYARRWESTDGRSGYVPYQGP